MVVCKHWGALPDGGTAHLYTITRGEMSLTVSDFGGIVTSLTVPDRNGKSGDVVLGYDTLTDYIQDDAFFGAMIGRYANRIGGAAFSLNGVRYDLTANERGNTLHGGIGFHKVLWQAQPEEYGVTLSRLSPDGEDGFPGNLRVTVRYELAENRKFLITCDAVSDRDTVVNLTNHSYFNLGYGGPIQNHLLWLNAENYTPTDEQLIPTGDILPVAGTIYDFRVLRPIGQYPYDINFALADGEGPKAVLCAPESGRRMVLHTDRPGLQLYTGGGLRERMGKYGSHYGPGLSVCLETQCFPDSPNRPQFPSCALMSGKTYHSRTEFRFETD